MSEDHETKFTLGRETPTLSMTRILHAPRQLVFETLTEPAHLTLWWGSFQDAPLDNCEVDLRLGGAWRFVEKLPDGSSLASGGTYEEIVPPSRIVQTLKFDTDPWKGRTARITFELEDLGDRTKLTIITQFATFSDRDGMDVEGARKTGEFAFGRLSRLLSRLQAG